MCVGDKVQDMTKSLARRLVDFNKTLDDLENIDVKLDDEDKVLLLLNSLCKFFDNFNDTLFYGNE